jgi:hypothetical protein
MSSTPPPFAPPLPPPEKKGIPPLGWVGIGCGSVLVIAILVGVVIFFVAKRKYDEFSKNPEKLAAEFVIKANPELRKVGENDGTGEMTVRTKDGKEFTISYKDLAEGKFSLKDADGNVTELGASDLSDVPAWVPQLPGVTGGLTAFTSDDKGKATGSYSVTTTESSETLVKFFSDEASKLGLNNSSNTSTNFGGIANSTHSFSSSARKISMVLSEQAGQPLHATVSYEEK